MKKFLASLALLAGCLVITNLNAAPVSAQEDTAETPAGSYEFTAERGDSLTKMVRRSLQLYAQREADTELSEPATVYAETNVTQRLGSTQLEVGQEVSVPFALLDEYVKNSANLTAAQVANWERYTTNVNFDVSHIQPTNVQDTSGTNVDEQADQDDQQPADNQDGEEAADGEDQDEQAADDENESTQWYWWVVGAATLGILYYLFGGRATNTKN